MRRGGVEAPDWVGLLGCRAYTPKHTGPGLFLARHVGLPSCQISDICGAGIINFVQWACQLAEIKSLGAG